MTLTEFLLARISEDEAVAVECQKLGADVGSLSGWVEIGSDEADAAVALADRFSPTRVDAECEAKQQIVELHEPHSPDPDDGPICRICDGNGKNFYWPCDTLRFLALPYADHQQFDEAWRP